MNIIPQKNAKHEKMNCYEWTFFFCEFRGLHDYFF